MRGVGWALIVLVLCDHAVCSSVKVQDVVKQGAVERESQQALQTSVPNDTTSADLAKVPQETDTPEKRASALATYLPGAEDIVTTDQSRSKLLHLLFAPCRDDGEDVRAWCAEACRKGEGDEPCQFYNMMGQMLTTMGTGIFGVKIVFDFLDSANDVAVAVRKEEVEHAEKMSSSKKFTGTGAAIANTFNEVNSPQNRRLFKYWITYAMECAMVHASFASVYVSIVGPVDRSQDRHNFTLAMGIISGFFGTIYYIMYLVDLFGPNENYTYLARMVRVVFGVKHCVSAGHVKMFLGFLIVMFSILGIVTVVCFFSKHPNVVAYAAKTIPTVWSLSYFIFQVLAAIFIGIFIMRVPRGEQWLTMCSHPGITSRDAIIPLSKSTASTNLVDSEASVAHSRRSVVAGVSSERGAGGRSTTVA